MTQATNSNQLWFLGQFFTIRLSTSDSQDGLSVLEHRILHGFLMKFVFALILCVFISVSVHACTIFVLTDTNRTLFCNNEDWINPLTRIWFVPSGTTNYGCVYVGFDDGIPQGGLNTKGLAFDWVAGTKETWTPDPGLPGSIGCRQMLETCATVDEAITFFQEHRELGFYIAKILVSDRTGTSAIIGAKGAKLQVEKSNQSRGFGTGEQTLKQMLTTRSSKPIVSNGAKILRATLQIGKHGTKYSNVFDLKSGDIFLFPFPGRDDSVKLNLAAELKKGGHYYDMPQIHKQLIQSPRPLLHNMERCLLDKYKPIPDREPKVTKHVRRIIKESLEGIPRNDDYTADAWSEESLRQMIDSRIIKSFGQLVSLTLVDRSEEGEKRSYRYRVQLVRNTLLQQLVFDKQNKLVSSRIEDFR